MSHVDECNEANLLRADLLDFVRENASTPHIAASALLVALVELTRTQGIPGDEYEHLIGALQRMRAAVRGAGFQ